MSWTISACDAQIVLNLCPHSTAKAMWDYLKKLYNQPNSPRRFQVECEIANYALGSLSIPDYFSAFQNLWSKFSDIVCATVPKERFADALAIHETSKCDQFLMIL